MWSWPSCARARKGSAPRKPPGSWTSWVANRLPGVQEPHVLTKLAKQFTHFFALMLWVAAVLAAIGGMPQLAVAIVVVVIVNGLFSFAQEERASRAAAALSELLPLRVSVLRDGRRAMVEADSLVPGDIVLLHEGDRISADARLLVADRLLVDNSTLTGESERVLATPLRLTISRSPSPPPTTSCSPGRTSRRAPVTPW